MLTFKLNLFVSDLLSVSFSLVKNLIFNGYRNHSIVKILANLPVLTNIYSKITYEADVLRVSVAREPL